MKSLSVTIAEGKKGFSHLVKEASEKKEEIVVTKRGEPVAVLLSYSEYKKIKRQKAFEKILKARRIFSKTKISAKEAYEESRRQLEKRI
jgi:prevent-host-death family protein